MVRDNGVVRPMSPAAERVIGAVALRARVPLAAGNVTVRVPSAPVVGVIVTDPEVALANARVPTVAPAVPRVGVAENADPVPPEPVATVPEAP